MRRPPALEPGARVALVAPAGPLRNEEELRVAEENVRAFGWEPVTGNYVLARNGYLAGSDDERLADFNAAARDPSIDAIWCVRGGYGAMRLLEEVDYEAFARGGKSLIGFSDITALHAAIGARADLVTFHGPTARQALTPFSRRSMEQALRNTGDPFPDTEELRMLTPGTARGPLAGGNLALLAALCGTAYAPRFDGAILVVEDVGEAVYRVDRMLTQLRLAGALERCVGIVFGQFTERPESPDGRPLDEVLEETARALDLPCIAGAPVGHVDDQWTIPLGAMAELDADVATLRLV